MLKVAGGGGGAGGLVYKGTWNASTNTPTLTSGVGSNGDYYVVSVAGTTNLDGITDWQVNDWAIFNGTAWQKIDNTDLVQSVNGQTGVVVLTAPDVGATPNTSYVLTSGLLSGGGQLTGNVTVSLTSVPVANVPGAVPNTTTITAGGLLSGGGNLASNVTISLVSVPSANVTGLGTMATQNANAVVITGGSISNVSLSNATVDGAAPYLNFANGAGTALVAGRQWYDGSNGSWNLGMGNGNITQQVGEEIYVYGKASSSISGGSILQAIYKTGTVGASGTIQFAPTVAGITDLGAIIGVGTEDITSGNFGRVTNFGIVHGINTNGSTYGETWVDGQDIWYNPVTGGLTKTKPVAPNIKIQIGTVINAGPGGSGSFQVLLSPGSSLGGTDSNVQISASPANNSFLTYNAASTIWTDTSPSDSRTALGLGTMATQNANNVSITGGSINVTNIAADNGIMLNSNTVSQNVTIPTGYNGLTGGPIAVANGITVTVSSNSVWTVV